MSSELELAPGTWTLGGAEDDGIRLSGLPPRLLELDLEAHQAWIRCTRPLPVGRAVLEPGVRRWLLPGERVRLSREAQLRVQALSEAPGTRALLRSLLDPGGAPLSSAAAALICVAGVDAGTVFLLAGPTLELGRSPACAVRLGDGAVSRRHLQLVLDQGSHRVRDLGSRNRARCNGRWLRSGLLLADGDLLAVGRSLLHYRTGTPEPGDSATGGAESPVVGPAAAPVSASVRARPVPPAAPGDGGAGRRSW